MSIKNNDILLESKITHACFEKVLGCLFNESEEINIPELYSQGLSLNSISINLPQQLKISLFRRHHEIVNKCCKHFPTVFYPVIINSLFGINLYNKIKLKLVGVPYIISTSQNFVFSTYSFSPLIFHLQIVQHFISNFNVVINSNIRFNCFDMFYDYLCQSIETCKRSHESTTAVSLWLNDQIGTTYAYGELIDFIDRIYDQYKFTQINPQCFHVIFRCFGSNTIGIANSAFDYYTDFRDSNSAWEKSISNFLHYDLCFSRDFATAIAQRLVRHD